MAERTSVVDLSGNNEETILQWAKDLGTSKIRRLLFNTIYGRGTKPRSKKQIMQAAKMPDGQAQQAQNELDHLWSTHLIVRVDNDGSVKDASRYLYQKDPGVRKNRKRIVQFADDPKAAAKVPTKRWPQLRGFSPVPKVTLRMLRTKKKLNVLYLTANPDSNHSLRVDAEVRRVQEAVRSSRYRDNISIEYRPAADLDSLIDGLNDYRPRIVHFSGHGNEHGILGDGPRATPSAKSIPFGLLARAIKSTDAPPDVIVLNACKSAGAKKAFFPAARAIVVMRESVTDWAAIAFATKFYAAIAAGQSVKSAFDQGKVAVEAVSISEADTPDLIVTAGVDARKIKLT